MGFDQMLEGRVKVGILFLYEWYVAIHVSKRKKKSYLPDYKIRDVNVVVLFGNTILKKQFFSFSFDFLLFFSFILPVFYKYCTHSS